jgi:hypothetical protein
MLRFPIAACLAAACLPAFAPLGAQCTDHRWAVSLQGAERDETFGLGTDSLGNAYLAGWFDSDTFTVGGTLAAVNTSLGQNGNGDAYLAKIGADGTPLWVRSAGGAQNSDWAWASATAPSGRSILAGEFFSNTMDFGGGVTLSRAGLSSAFVAVYEADGSLAWARRFGQTGTTAAFAAAFAPDGAVCVTGAFEGAVPFSDSGVVSQGGDDVFLAVWEPDGTERWARSMGGAGFASGSALAVAPDGTLYVGVRWSSATVSFAGGTATNAGLTDIAVLAYGADGAELGWFHAGGDQGDEVEDLGVDAAGNVYAAGSFSSTDLDVDGTVLATAGVFDLWWARFGPALDLSWWRTAGGTGNDRWHALDLDAAGRPVCAGRSGNAAFSLGGVSVSEQGLLLAGFDTAGATRWAESHGGNLPQFDEGWAVAAAPDGDVLASGKFLSNTVDFGGGVEWVNGGGFANSEVGLVRRRLPYGLEVAGPAPVDSLCAGASPVLEAGVAAPVPDGLSYAWFRDGTALPGATGPTLALSAIDPAASGSYTCRVGDGCDSAVAGPFPLVVLPGPPAPVLGLTAGGDSLVVTGPGEAFFWFLDGAPLPFTGAVIPWSGSGAYTAFAVLGGCPGPWSDPLVLSGQTDTDPSVSWRAWPQPSRGTLQVEGLPAGTWALALVDATGRTVASRDGVSGAAAVRWDLPELAPGAYVLVARSPDGRNASPRALRILVARP